MNFKLSLSGHQIVDQVLREMPTQFSHRVLGAAHAAAAKPIIPDAQAKIRNKTGNLSKSIGTEKVAMKKATAIGLVRVGPRRRGGYKGNHGHLVEFGHRIKNRKDGKVLGFVKPYPFMEPAFIQNKSLVESNIKEELGKKLHSFMKRFVKKTGGTWIK